MPSPLEDKVIQAAQNVLNEQISWSYAFGITNRLAETVEGNPRDTIDTGETYDSVDAQVTDQSITVNFQNDAAASIFAARSEIDELVGDEVANRLAVDIVKMLLDGGVG